MCGKVYLDTPELREKVNTNCERVMQLVSSTANSPGPFPFALPHGRPAIAGLIDHTLLKPGATRDDIRALCTDALQCRFAAVCVNPYWVEVASKELASSGINVATVTGFPLGATTITAKLAETADALRNGAREIDMVIQIGALRSGDYEGVLDEIAVIVALAHGSGAVVKTIIETALLTDPEKIAACTLATIAGADFVKTSTGFSAAGATARDVRLMRLASGPGMGIKAAGGIRTLAQLEEMVAAGATRIGTSAGMSILEELR